MPRRFRLSAFPRDGAWSRLRRVTRERLFASSWLTARGNGTVAGRLGFERLRETERQPGSFVYTLKANTDLSKLDEQMLQARFNQAVRAGTVQSADCRCGLLQFLRQGANTGNYIEGADNSTAEARTETNLRGRRSMLRMYRFLEGGARTRKCEARKHVSRSRRP